MDAAIKLVSAIFFRLATSPIAAAARLMPAFLMVAFAIALAVAALGCGITALWLVMLPHLGPIGAPLASAGCLLVVSAILALCGRAMFRQQRGGSIGLPMAVAPLAGMSHLLGENGAVLLLAALLAGLEASRRVRRGS
jgi:hypothetical protein